MRHVIAERLNLIHFILEQRLIPIKPFVFFDNGYLVGKLGKQQ